MDLFTEVYATLFQRSHSTFSIVSTLIPFFLCFLYPFSVLSTSFCKIILRIASSPKLCFQFHPDHSIHSPSIHVRVYEKLRTKLEKTLEKTLFLSPVIPHDCIRLAARTTATDVTSVAFKHCVSLGAVAIMTWSIILKSGPSIRMIACI